MRSVYLPVSILSLALLCTQAPAAALDPQYQAKGAQKRTYSFPGTGESIPYRLYASSKWNKNAKLPLVVHGDHDQVTSYDASVAQVQRAKEHGLEVEFIPVKDGEHFTAWTFVVPQIFDFFDKHRKKTQP